MYDTGCINVIVKDFQSRTAHSILRWTSVSSERHSNRIDLGDGILLIFDSQYPLFVWIEICFSCVVLSMIVPMIPT